MATKKKAPAKPKLKKIDFKEEVKEGATVTIASQHYVALAGNKLKSKTTGEVFSY